VHSEAYKAARVDGEETIFTCVNGLCGNLYLSGRLDASDDTNRALTHEAVALYKREREHIHAAYPFWPLGFNRIGDATSWTAVGLADEDNTRVLLAVWRRDSARDTMDLPLRGWAGREARVRVLYPGGEEYAVPFQYHTASGVLAITLPKTTQARYFEVTAV
jgi:alpha-galactosidase